MLQLSLALACGLLGDLRADEAINPRYSGTPFIRTWTAEDYDAAPVNYDTVQHPVTGFLYAANDYGVLEFDGETWRLIELPKGASARAVTIDALGRVWAGGVNEIVRLEPDAQGRLRATSMFDRLPPAARALGTIASAIAAADGVYLVGSGAIYFFPTEGPARTWPAPPRANTALWFGDAFHCATADGGLYTIRGDSVVAEITPTRNSAPASGPILGGRAAPGGGWQLLTARGPARWAGGDAPLVFERTEANAALEQTPAVSAIFLRNGGLAFGRATGGVLLFSSDGRLQQTLDRTRGLSGNRVEHLLQDTDGGLWIAQRSGLARVQIDSPLAKHGVAQGVDGRPRALLRHDGRLYLAHNEGGAWRDDATGQFHPITGLEVGLKRFLSVGPQLLATSTSLYALEGGRGTALARLTLTPLVALPGTAAETPALLGGGPAKVWLFARENGSWKNAGALAHAPAGAESLVPTSAGFVWGAAVDGRIWRADFRAGARLDAPVVVYGPEQGVPAIRQRDGIELFPLGDDILAVSGAWILRYDRTNDRFVPEPRIAGLPAGLGASHAHADAAGSLWLQLAAPDLRLLHIHRDATGAWRADPLALPPIVGLAANRLYHDAVAHTLWLACQGALVSVDLDWRAAAQATPPRAALRRVETMSRELLFDGAPTAAVSPDLPAAQNELRFTFAAPAFDGDFLGRGQTLYRTRLDGVDRDWTPWSTGTVREFTNLPFRALTFRVEARAPDGPVGPPAVWSFVIAPPWWLTRGMFAGYALAGVLAIAGVVHWRTRTQRRRADKLEAIVASRTEELRQSNAELARLHAIERDEKLAARLDEEKARLEMLRYQLNPHFLYNTLAAICGTARTNPEATRTMAQRLADFCRLTLTRPDEMDTVREEVRMLRSYLDIEKARWRDQLQIEIDVAEAALDCRLPTFLLLPLIENAIKHGGQTTRGVLHLRLAMHCNDGALHIEVSNSGTWDPATPKDNSTGIGLENLRRRLARHFPDAHAFTIGAEGDRVVARLQIRPIDHRLAGRENQASLKI